jgi:hypothetical protein
MLSLYFSAFKVEAASATSASATITLTTNKLLTKVKAGIG